MINRWLRRFLPQTLGERDLRAVLDSAVGIDEVIHFEEVGLPNGKITTMQWLFGATSATFRVSDRQNRREVYAWRSIELEPLEFVDLIKEIRHLDSISIESFNAPVRDGVAYFIAWGDRSKIRSVTLRNPEKDSKQQRLVDLIKSNAVNPESDTAD